MATENILMAGVGRGGDRQDLHERIRGHSQAVAAASKRGLGTNDLLDRLRADPLFAGIGFGAGSNAQNYIGRAPQQVDEFLQDVVGPIQDRYAKLVDRARRFKFESRRRLSFLNQPRITKNGPALFQTLACRTLPPILEVLQSTLTALGLVRKEQTRPVGIRERRNARQNGFPCRLLPVVEL